MAGVRKLQVEETEAALKEAAQRVFARQGYLNTKITDITSEAGRAAGSFYRHFSSKESLLESLLTDMLKQGDTATEDPAHSTDFTDRAAVRWHIALHWAHVREHLPVMTALHQAAMVDEHFAARARDLLAPDLRHMAAHLEHISAAGGRLPGDPLVVASAMTGMVWQFALTWLAGPGHGPELGRELSDDEAIETLTSFVMHGISGQPADSAREP